MLLLGVWHWHWRWRLNGVDAQKARKHRFWLSPSSIATATTTCQVFTAPICTSSAQPGPMTG
ncbi:hypothetical protein BD289DRAFT_423108 [Coniella lustricola]|uniref:Uncharacterized protein n=1 Tax=Coniella lustricola TaxID=2025994 RepID=A0A2T3AK52_9PEZI|nr:hypothetical protein BD289DRAFT_423108 [Coniella lustricola]